MKRLLLIPLVAIVALLMFQWLILKMEETVRDSLPPECDKESTPND